MLDRLWKDIRHGARSLRRRPLVTAVAALSLRLVLGHVSRMTIVGVAVGSGAAIALSRLSTSLVFGVAGAEPAVMVGAVIGVTVVALVAAAVPAARAAMVEPAIALRAD